MEIVPGFHWINGGSSNYYLIVEEEQLTLIDTGMPGQLDNLLRHLSRIGRRADEISRILVTHADIDHVGSLQVMQAETGARVFASAQSAALIRRGKSPQHLPRLMQWIADRMSYKAVAAQYVQLIEPEEVLPIWGGLQVLATPGHTLDHLSFYCPRQGVVIAGDILNTRKESLNLTPKRITADMTLARQSARQLLALTPAVLACGHGTPLHGHKDDVLMRLYRQLA
jgi:glyoxylase-like metal-dependent hydrolase (beta-lactamase superfamily II)